MQEVSVDQCDGGRSFCYSLVTSYQSLVPSYYQLLVTSYYLLIISYQLPVSSHQLPVSSHQLLVINIVISYYCSTSYQSPVASEVTIYQLLQIICNMVFIRHKKPFPEHFIRNVFAVTFMMNVQFLKHLLSATALNVQEQPFKVALHKIVLKNFPKISEV